VVGKPGPAGELERVPVRVDRGRAIAQPRGDPGLQQLRRDLKRVEPDRLGVTVGLRRHGRDRGEVLRARGIDGSQ
jgi:hypothetical protein